MFRPVRVVEDEGQITHLYQAVVTKIGFCPEVMYRCVDRSKGTVYEEYMHIDTVPLDIIGKLNQKLKEENMKNITLTTNYPLQGNLFTYKLSLTTEDGADKEYTCQGVVSQGLGGSGGFGGSFYHTTSGYVGGGNGGGAVDYKYTFREVVKKTIEELMAEESIKKAELALEAAKNTLKTIKEKK